MVPCASCRREVAEGFAFCPYCGAAIAGATAGGDERKLVTVLFADVAGSTSLAETLDAEVVRDLMGEYFAVAREEIESRGGTVEKFIGDAVMAVFGVPVTHEDDPARALRSALAIRSRLNALGERADGAGKASLRVRIGINTGEVVATTSPRPGEGMVTGDAVNLAARLQQLADPDQIVVGERTAAASSTFTFGPLGDRQVKGKAEAVSIRELLGEIAGAEERGVPGLRSPLVGRDSEMELLQSLYERVAMDAPAAGHGLRRARGGQESTDRRIPHAPRRTYPGAHRPARPMPVVRERRDVLADGRDPEVVGRDSRQRCAHRGRGQDRSPWCPCAVERGHP
jgi:class 3 adenylate cyclase